MNTEQYGTKPVIPILSSDSESSKWILDYDTWHDSPIFRKAEVLPGWLYIPHVLLYAIRKAAWGFSEMLPISNYSLCNAISFHFY